MLSTALDGPVDRARWPFADTTDLARIVSIYGMTKRTGRPRGAEPASLTVLKDAACEGWGVTLRMVVLVMVVDRPWKRLGLLVCACVYALGYLA